MHLFIDGVAMLHAAVYWPIGGKVLDILKGVRNYLSKYLSEVPVYLVFDRCYENSIKSDTGMERSENLRRSNNMMVVSPLPPKDVVLKVTKTKDQLISLIADDLLNHFRDTLQICNYICK